MQPPRSQLRATCLQAATSLRPNSGARNRPTVNSDEEITYRQKSLPFFRCCAVPACVVVQPALPIRTESSGQPRQRTTTGARAAKAWLQATSLFCQSRPRKSRSSSAECSCQPTRRHARSVTLLDSDDLRRLGATSNISISCTIRFAYGAQANVESRFGIGNPFSSWGQCRASISKAKAGPGSVSDQSAGVTDSGEPQRSWFCAQVAHDLPG